jgi:PhnB protein
MASRLNPYLTFDGHAREAMEFYEGVFGGTLDVSTFGDFGQSDPAIADTVMHAQLETPNGFTLMAADPAPGTTVTRGDTMAISLSGDDREALRGWWEALVDGGTITTPLETQMWGDEFGMCTDRYGVAWLVNIAGSAR